MRELAVALPRALAAFPARIASRPVRLSMTPRMRARLLVAAAITIALGCIYQFWFRDSSFVAVERVEVSGLTTKDASSIRAALEAAGEDMTTLHVNREALDDVARRFPAIKSIQVETDFPHGLHIRVIERVPAALVMLDDTPLPVAGDGTVLTGVRPPKGLPVLRTEKPQQAGRLTDEETLRALLVVGAAPAGLPQRIERVSEGSQHGIVIELRDGPDVFFGDADRAGAKWVAATRVLADPDAAGASYIDVRLPERPVAGGLPVETIQPVAPAGEPIAVPPPAAIDPATGLAIDPATGAPADPAAAPAPVTPDPAPEAPAPVPTQPGAAAPTPQGTPQATPTGGVTSP